MIYKLPKHYISLLDDYETLEAKHLIKTYLIRLFKNQYNLLELTMPQFGEYDKFESGNINFDTKDDLKIYSLFNNYDDLILSNLIKYKINNDKGILTFNNTIDRNQSPDPCQFYSINKLIIELVIDLEKANSKYLINTFANVLENFKNINTKLIEKFPSLTIAFNREVKIISFQEVENEFGYLSFEERINAITEKHKIVLIYGLSQKLNSKLIYQENNNFYNDNYINARLYVYNKYYRFSYDLLDISIRRNINSDNKISDDIKDSRLKPLLKMNQNNKTSISIKINLFKLSIFLLGKANISEIQMINLKENSN